MILALAAAHRGPYEALKPVARAWPGRVAWVLDSTAAAAARAESAAFSRPPSDWDAWLGRSGAAAVLRGTSELPERRNPEAALARAAARRGLPVFALEDFPGNYAGPAAGLAGLFVEFSSLRAHHAARGLDAARVHAFGNPRYARRVPPLRRRRGSAPVVLWAGQPDGRRCRLTLAALAPALRALGATVLLRAHPRDAGGAGAYARLLRGITVVDAGSLPAAEALAASDLAVTQFSSMAVEAAASGVPALFALLPGAGADYLRERAGLERLPWCEDGAAFLLDDPRRARAVLARALLDAPARRAALSAMRAHFGACRGAARRVASKVIGSLR